ncbi:putative Importin subunit beta-1 protein, partial [Naja naja]
MTSEAVAAVHVRTVPACQQAALLAGSGCEWHRQATRWQLEVPWTKLL